MPAASTAPPRPPATELSVPGVTWGAFAVQGEQGGGSGSAMVHSAREPPPHRPSPRYHPPLVRPATAHHARRSEGGKPPRPSSAPSNAAREAARASSHSPGRSKSPGGGGGGGGSAVSVWNAELDVQPPIRPTSAGSAREGGVGSGGCSSRPGCSRPNSAGAARGGLGGSGGASGGVCFGSCAGLDFDCGSGSAGAGGSPPSRPRSAKVRGGGGTYIHAPAGGGVVRRMDPASSSAGAASTACAPSPWTGSSPCCASTESAQASARPRGASPISAHGDGEVEILYVDGEQGASPRGSPGSPSARAFELTELPLVSPAEVTQMVQDKVVGPPPPSPGRDLAEPEPVE